MGSEARRRYAVAPPGAPALIRSYTTLDGIRGVAAACIVVLHADRYFEGVALPVAHLAVDLFFVLSGFVLAHAYQEKLSGGLQPGRFMALRLIRLYPLYILGTALGIIQAALATAFQQGAVAWSWPDFWSALPAALFMLPSPGGALFPFNTPMWSIFFEVLVNLAWVLFWRPLLSTRKLVAVVVVAGGLTAWGSYYWGSTNLGIGWATFFGGVARVTFGFFLGVLLYRLHTTLRLPRVPVLALLVAPPLLFAAPMPPALQIVTALVILPSLVLLGSRVQPVGWLARLCHWIGVSSYAAYALHKPLYYLSYAALLKLGWDAREAAPWIGGAFLVALIAGCATLHYVYDEPARRWLGATVGQRRRLSTAAP